MKEKAFTIIELSVSIFILSVAIIGVYNAFLVLVVLTTNASDRFIGAYLAQEGVEIVNNIRGNNWILGNDWKTGLSDASTDCANGCQGDYKTTGAIFSPLLPYASGGTYLKIDSNGFYSYSDGQGTRFKRKITIIPQEDYDYILNVFVEVFWDEKPTLLNPNGQIGSIKVREILYNWY